MGTEHHLKNKNYERHKNMFSPNLAKLENMEQQLEINYTEKKHL